MIDRETQDRARPFYTRLHEHQGWGRLRSSDAPDWYQLMLSALVLAAGEEEVTYVSASPLGDEGSSVHIVAFTATLVLTVDVADSNDLDAFVVEVRPRRTLRTYRVGASQGIFSTDFARDWPGEVSVSLTYDDGLVVELPLSLPSSAEYRGELGELLGTLRADLMHP